MPFFQATIFREENIKMNVTAKAHLVKQWLLANVLECTQLTDEIYITWTAVAATLTMTITTVPTITIDYTTPNTEHKLPA